VVVCIGSLQGPLDLILAADTVWLNELVEPFVNALRAFTSGDNAAAGKHSDTSTVHRT
jgi:hypothetical protein